MPLSPEELRERARTWTEPISAEAPAGTSAKHEPAYEVVAQEVARLESPTGAPVSWSKVVAHAGELLRGRTKDLWLASYLAYGLHATEGLGGAVTGVAVLTEVLDRYWPTLFPESKRLRGRMNAVGWFVDRMAAALPAVQVSAGDVEVVESLHAVTRRLAEVARTRFDDQGPALGPLLEALERLRAHLPATVQPPVPLPTPTAQPAPSPAAAPSSQAAPAPAAPTGPCLPTVPTMQLSGAGTALDFLRGLGTSLLDAARVLRKANTADPLPYRILRVGLWLHITQPPAADPTHKTQVPALPPPLRTRLAQLEAHERWAELLEEAESALEQYRFVLDLQRYSATALAGLGPSHAPARDALRLEVAALLKRMPGVVELLASDGTPFTDERTRQWLEAELLEHPTPPAPAPRTGETPDDDPSPLPNEVRELLAAGKAPEAIALLHRQVAAASTGRARFKARLRLARLCVLSGQHLLSQALYETLVTESTTRGLDDWEPALSAECLEGVLLITRIVQKNTSNPSPEYWSHFRRLAQLDPSASLRLGR
jgi:type VI secretion system protein VasJ